MCTHLKFFQAKVNFVHTRHGIWQHLRKLGPFFINKFMKTELEYLLSPCYSNFPDVHPSSPFYHPPPKMPQKVFQKNTIMQQDVK